MVKILLYLLKRRLRRRQTGKIHIAVGVGQAHTRFPLRQRGLAERVQARDFDKLKCSLQLRVANRGGKEADHNRGQKAISAADRDPVLQNLA